jgi:hypothetical protein
VRRSPLPPTLRVDPAAAGPAVRVARGPRGLGLAPTAPPGGVAPAGGPLRLVAGAPFAGDAVAVVAGGRLVLAVGPGVAATFRAPELHAVHDRRPPGVDAIAGAPLANAGLLHAEGGWRAVVLPSLGDLIPDLGPGPVALRADGRRVAAARDGVVVEREVGGEGVVVTHATAAAALAYDGAGRLRVGGPGVRALAGAAAAPVALALGDDDQVTLLGEGDAPLARWRSPVPGALRAALSADGARAVLVAPAGPEPAACVARAEDGAVLNWIAGARDVAPAPEGGALALVGEWGVAWAEPAGEDG